MLLTVSSGTYNLKCYDCWTINNFFCTSMTLCPTDLRRCMTISVRKYLFVFLGRCELGTPPEHFQGAV